MAMFYVNHERRAAGAVNVDVSNRAADIHLHDGPIGRPWESRRWDSYHPADAGGYPGHRVTNYANPVMNDNMDVNDAYWSLLRMFLKPLHQPTLETKSHMHDVKYDQRGKAVSLPNRGRPSGKRPVAPPVLQIEETRVSLITSELRARFGLGETWQYPLLITVWGQRPRT